MGCDKIVEDPEDAKLVLSSGHRGPGGRGRMTEDFDPSDEYQHEDNIGVYNSNPLTVKPEHLKLLRRMRVRWNDGSFGAPEISAKKPYGNSSVIEDIREITEMPNADRDWCVKVHREMEAVLQVTLSEEEPLSPGDKIIYRDYNWIRYEEDSE